MPVVISSSPIAIFQHLSTFLFYVLLHDGLYILGIKLSGIKL